MPLRFRPRVVAALAAAVALTCTTPSHALRVTSWNLLDYNASNVAGRQATFRTVMAALSTDVLIVQEIKDAQSADSMLVNVLRVSQPARVWKLAGFIATTESALYYDSLQVSVASLSAISTGGPRQVLQCIVRPNGYRTNASSFRLYSVHFKAGNPASSPTDSTTRRVECTSLRTTFNNAPAGTNILMGGDTNFYGSWEGGYIRLTESQLDNDGRLQDPLVMPGTWNQSGYAAYHTQSPCLSGCGGIFSGGGMDDRFDLFLGSTPLFDGAGLDVVPGNLANGYGAFGNDGLHYNNDINGGGFNAAVGLTVANALKGASDHLPVIVTLQLPAKVNAPSALAFGDVIVGASPVQNLSVGNAAPVPGDELDYTLTAPAGFGAPGGAFVLNAGAAAASHAITMNAASVGAKAGVLTIASDDPDTASKQVQLSGTVLAHAAGSLDSLVASSSLTFDWGARPAGSFADSAVRVFNLGWNALQARLALSAAAITGGAGRFALTSPFAPQLVAGTPAALDLRFDPAGATLDSTYEATLTLTAGDEALPGASTPAALTVTLRARVLGNSGVGDGPTALRFLPPRPNPARGATALAFELPAEAPVSLAVYDLGGRRVALLHEGSLGAGRHELRWIPRSDTGRPVAAGLYFVRFSTPGLTRIERLVLLP